MWRVSHTSCIIRRSCFVRRRLNNARSWPSDQIENIGRIGWNIHEQVKHPVSSQVSRANGHVSNRKRGRSFGYLQYNLITEEITKEVFNSESFQLVRKSPLVTARLHLWKRGKFLIKCSFSLVSRYAVTTLPGEIFPPRKKKTSRLLPIGIFRSKLERIFISSRIDRKFLLVLQRTITKKSSIFWFLWLCDRNTNAGFGCRRIVWEKTMKMCFQNELIKWQLIDFSLKIWPKNADQLLRDRSFARSLWNEFEKKSFQLFRVVFEFANFHSIFSYNNKTVL